MSQCALENSFAGVLALGLGSSVVADNDQSVPELRWQSPLRCSVGQDVLNKNRKVFMLAESHGCCLAPAELPMLSAWAWIFSDSG